MMGNGCDAIRKRGRSRAGLRARRAVGPFTAFCPACGGCHVSCRWNADWSGLPTRVERCHAVLITQRSQVQILPGYQVVEDRNHISGVEHRLDYDFAREAPQIMLCAYLYARLNPGLGRRQPRNWPGFVQQFCTHSRLHKPEAYDDLRQYLQIPLASRTSQRTTCRLLSISTKLQRLPSSSLRSRKSHSWPVTMPCSHSLSTAGAGGAVRHRG